MSTTQSKVWLVSNRLKAADLGAAGLVLVHGGAGPQDPKGEQFLNGQRFLSQMLTQVDGHLPGDLTPTVRQNWQDLTLAGKLSLDAGRRLESEPMLNSGVGASLQADGMARVSASFMESRARVFSAIMNTTEIEHPSELALFLQKERFSVLDSLGARHLALKLGVPKKNIITPQRLERWVRHKKLSLESGTDTGRSGTIGALAIDPQKNLAALTSTGGVGNETPGRVGDSPTIAGNYCSQQVAVSCTGIGEQIISHAVSPRLALAVENGKSLSQAARECFELACAQGFEFAAIAAAYYPASDEIEWVAASSHCQLLWGLKIDSNIIAPN